MATNVSREASSKTVSYCNDSTITEAWIAIQGYPAKLNDEEISAINNEATKSFKSIKRMPTVTIIPKTDSLHPAFWTAQFSYGDDSYLARIGHRYLSVHIICKPDDVKRKYTSYSEVLKPELEKWMDVYSRVLSVPSDFHVESLVFGYTNSFVFSSDTFDAGEYFNINVGADIGNENAKVSSLNSAYTFFDSIQKEHISVSVNIVPVLQQNTLELKTQVFTEKKGLSKISIQNKDAIFDSVHSLKEKSKSTFFSFATLKTHKLMGATYGTSKK